MFVKMNILIEVCILLQGKLVSNITNVGGQLQMVLRSVKFYGYPRDPKRITMNGNIQQFLYDSQTTVGCFAGLLLFG